jgi:hypothetical protein
MKASATLPTITKYGVLPIYGDVGATVFRFFLTYTDADNDSPLAGYPKGLKGPSTTYTWPVFTFLGNDSDDTNYTDGKAYYFDYYYYPVVGVTVWNFEVKSGVDAVVRKLIATTTNAVLPSSPLPFNIYPANTDIGPKVFTFNYTSEWGNTPLGVNVTVDGISYPMTKNNTGDTVYIDGCMFHKNLTLNTSGLHHYSFQWHETSYLYPIRESGQMWLILIEEPDYNKWIVGITICGIILGVGFFIFVEKKKR